MGEKGRVEGGQEEWVRVGKRERVKRVGEGKRETLRVGKKGVRKGKMGRVNGGKRERGERERGKG